MSPNYRPLFSVYNRNHRYVFVELVRHGQKSHATPTCRLHLQHKRIELTPDPYICRPHISLQLLNSTTPQTCLIYSLKRTLPAWSFLWSFLRFLAHARHQTSTSTFLVILMRAATSWLRYDA